MKRKNEAGFTLIEMLVVISLVAIIVGGAAVSITSILKSTDISNAQAAALRQVQNAGFWVSRDILMAKGAPTIDPGSSGFPVSLKYDEWNESTETFVEREVQYVFDGDKLKRRVVGGAASEILIAEYIVEVGTKTKIELSGAGEYKLTVKASYKDVFGKADVERAYQIKQRLGS